MVTARAVTRTVLAGLLHQVKVIACGAARVVAIVHAQQADDFKRNRPHGHGRGKGHATGPETLLQRRLLQRLQPSFLRHSQRNLLHKTGLVTGFLPACERFFQPIEQGTLYIILRLKHVLRQLAQALRPDIGRGIQQCFLPPAHQALEHRGQNARQFGTQPADFVIGLNLAPGSGTLPAMRSLHTAAAAGIAEQHAAQTKPGAVVLTTGLQAQRGALLGIQSPADTCTRHPMRELRHIGGRQAKACGHGGDIQQITQLAQAAALLG